MFKKTIPVAVAVVLSLSAGAAIADQTFHPSNDEAGTIMHVVPGVKSRAQVDAEQRATATKNVVSDGWRYVGGEPGWELVQHAYAFRGGKLVHIDKQVDAEQRATATKNVVSDGWRYVGGEPGWELVQHAYAFRGGKLVHIDNIDHNTPKPSLSPIIEGRERNQALYSGR